MARKLQTPITEGGGQGSEDTTARYYLLYEVQIYHPMRPLEPFNRLQKSGPYSTPLAAREVWKNEISNWRNTHSPSVVYQEFEL
jgi:hypothetical protein